MIPHIYSSLSSISSLPPSPLSLPGPEVSVFVEGDVTRLARYHTRFVWNFSDILVAKQLTALLMREAAIKWGPKELATFDVVLIRVICLMILLSLQSASGVALGEVLSQLREDLERLAHIIDNLAQQSRGNN